ncbi:MAG: accessory factor UbiK family protein [Rhodospirillaceae bacterium]|jgi:BMFP domain-containing protein YqiC|nr:accessory factor UbiK family protein [Rhodospirillaceae bacterium]MBT5912431.1 accessory factor UbiK family protein [Rhodospirillaceae bacterium]MBT6307020.1 accessory factor UbiK family protein [Rhodospirillaceae bacterium]MBT7730386.1 accessory factor UbiK family protein [Rhodospirillaceae bacterium]MDC1441128.1 accessory factor UbiK family protein [Rhodospirillaceae bacterium]
MQSNNRILSDLTRVATGAMSVAAGARDEIEQILQHRFERFLNERGWVSREEFDAVSAMAQKAREGQETMLKSFMKLEERLKKLESSKMSTRLKSGTERP